MSYSFGRDVVQDFIESNNISLICRAHQVVEDGYEFFNRRQVLNYFRQSTKFKSVVACSW